MPSGYTEEFVSVGGAKIQLFKGGAGEPLLLLHGAGGNTAWLRYAQALAERFAVYLPALPGFGKSERPQWLNSMTDLACFGSWLQEELGIEGCRAIGFSMGGWLAAEMAAVSRHAFSRLLLVDPVGVKPQQGEIADVFILTSPQINQLAYHNPRQTPEYAQLEERQLTQEEANIVDRNRETAARLCWKPYMHSPSLPGRLARVKIPVHIVWGRQDGIVPLECGELYQGAIAGAGLTVIDQCGHLPQVEKPAEFIETALEFFR